ncbi:MAG: ribonuclease HI [Candidatus Gallimonas sp.]
MRQTQVVLYTDGACSGNPGAGGWGAILLCGERRRELSGSEAETTNNRMEITAVIEGLERLKYPCRVDVYSDSAYTVNAFLSGWIYGWEKNGWKKSDGSPVLNTDLWQRLLRLTRTHEVVFHKVKGHADNELNNRCDELARAAISALRTENIDNSKKNGI